MRIQDWDQLHDIVVGATTEVFETMALPVTYAGSRPYRSVEWADVIAVIGYGGRLRGSLVLSIPTKLARESHPTRSALEDDVNDWLAELSNLLLGRIKSRLLARSITIELSTPLAISATKVRFERFQGTPVVHAFERDGETVHAMFEAVAEKTASLAPPKTDGIVGAGEMVMF